MNFFISTVKMGQYVLLHTNGCLQVSYCFHSHSSSFRDSAVFVSKESCPETNKTLRSISSTRKIKRILGTDNRWNSWNIGLITTFEFHVCFPRKEGMGILTELPLLFNGSGGWTNCRSAAAESLRSYITVISRYIHKHHSLAVARLEEETYASLHLHSETLCNRS